MSSSRTPNAETWIHGWSTTMLSRFQLSVSLDERITLMEAFTNPYELMQNGTIDPWLLDTNTHTDFHSAQITCRNLTNGYVTTCLEVVSLTPTHGQLRDGPPSLRGDPP